MTRDPKRDRSRNEELREYLLGGATVASPKIAALDLPTLRQLISQLARYDDFSETVGRFDDHAFGMFDFQGATIVFKIEMTSLAGVGQSRSTPFAKADRIMTIMFAEEYATKEGN
ncbi:DUF3768 domain-containing protein [Bradyrhizobium liaoningense]|uniref:DUF3768 domain-containing protein n=1 Tax=Bradyrhizobium liaoningense TaxID=43992 RepID=UPI001BA850F2|nr:DUF3768 domain-containing protein [Bradyrhizobium liaoningense]MBR0904559.1 DUF3768 domain-containing protein [Bradyrhizobium liaoningense]